MSDPRSHRELHPEVLAEMHVARSWYADRSQPVALRFVQGLDQICQDPQVGRVARGEVTTCRIKNFPYSLP